MLQHLSLVIAALGLAACTAAHGPSAGPSVPSDGGAAHAGAHGSYGGHQQREIATLSQDDLAQLRRGAGWGMALAAEVNGYPGPRHLLDLREELALTPAQVAGIERIYARMQSRAITAGERFIAAERALSDAFADRTVDASALGDLTARAGAARAALRQVHLPAHLEATPLLSEEQIARYNVLRGYAGDPCDTVPAGHDPQMWRRHNGCAAE